LAPIPELEITRYFEQLPEKVLENQDDIDSSTSLAAYSLRWTPLLILVNLILRAAAVYVLGGDWIGSRR
jgi:transcription termination factor NusB